MTGYGKKVLSKGETTVSVEIRTLNSKQLDINLKLPSYLKQREIEVRRQISNSLLRGKIDVAISIEQNSVVDVAVIDDTRAEHYYNEINKLSSKLNLPQPDNLVELLVKMPDLFIQLEKEAEEEEINLLNGCLSGALDEVNKARTNEGMDLEKDFRLRIGNILEQLAEVDSYDSNRIERIRERILSNINKFLSEHDSDRNRLEQEIIYYIEKLDITEEKVRLANNCKYFLDNLDNEESSGKKLGFITQEIGREINTLGSKANDSDLQKIVVLMKDELEKIKEQLFNIL